jgi:hypothetical protein
VTYTPIPKGTDSWDVPVNAAFVDQDTRITTNAANITANGVSIAALQTLTNTLERQPSERGFKSWTMQPETTQSLGTIAVSGAMRLQRHKLRVASTITNLHMGVLVVGSGLTAGQNFMGIYDTAGNLLAQTADQSTNWTTVGMRTSPLTAPINLPAGDFYVGFLANGTTPPTFARGHDNSSSFINGLTPSGQHLYISNGAGLTALPATVSLVNTSSTAFWSGTS